MPYDIYLVIILVLLTVNKVLVTWILKNTEKWKDMCNELTFIYETLHACTREIDRLRKVIKKELESK